MFNDLSYIRKIWTDFSTVSSQCTRMPDGQTDGRTDRQTDIQTDRQTEFSSLDRVCIPCSEVKTRRRGNCECIATWGRPSHDSPCRHKFRRHAKLEVAEPILP